MKKVDSKTTMLLHSEAKVEFYKKYLQRYIRIIGLSGQVTQTNIFDVFCGTGIYDNGKKGSPIAAFDEIQAFCSEYPQSGVAIHLFVNDGAAGKVDTVQEYIDSVKPTGFDIHYSRNAAEVSFGEIHSLIATQDSRSRNLIFIDPYGYKELDRKSLESLLENGRTELIIFLPISHMQRFTVKALDSDEAAYAPLKRFVTSFFGSDHPIQHGTIPAGEYVAAVKEALKFGKYFSTSFTIERDSSNLYTVFFVSPHVYGYEKILEVKWSMDDDEGRGFSQPDNNPQFSFFQAEEKRLAQEENYLRLEGLIRDFLKDPKDNRSIYIFVLQNEFLPKHANEVLRRWQDMDLLGVKYVESGESVRKGWFYLNWENYKIGTPKVTFSLER